MNHFDQYTQIQIHKSSELLINAPRDRVWPYLLDFSTFNDTFERIELVSGVKDSVDAVSRLTKRKGDWWVPPYMVKIIHLDPGKQIVWKMFPEEGEESHGFVDFSLSSVNAQQTLFMIRLYKERRISMRTPEGIARAKQDMIDSSNRLEREMMFPNLKRLAERAVA